ncbi:hypothetical protein [Mycolicibacterium moriokaense]|uniref:Uncharacterized protein n=1 Tax=Mycolicibacterium moriokaense TaxID=39691 RepID=A0A318HL07_9MYCO|nr:hypothetical protein [Mycolicibacterium moriokaense]PXX11896.1 hypothetical protein C8E89_10220 [Mycolicibacterium moriokaense]
MPATRSRTASLLAAAGAAFAVSALIGAAPAAADDLVCSDSEVAVDGACVAVVSNTDAPPPDATPLDSSPNDVAPPPDDGSYVDSIIAAPGYNAGTDDGGDHTGGDGGGGHGH